MWRLNKIEARNLCTFRELNYTLQQGVTTLVFGDNRDNESQRSNGSGKSALIEAIALALTGSTLRRVRTEEIINDNAEECFLRAVLENTTSDETFTVERTLQRKGASVVRVIGVNDTPIIQPSVEAYNKYILEKLGISREELYNNFILSKYKYTDFLSSADREKKEIINRFSNAVLVDQAIDKVEEDLAPLAEQLHHQELEMAGIEGRIEVIAEQIARQEQARSERERTRTERITQAREDIAAKRQQIRTAQQQAEALTAQMPQIDKAEQRLRATEKGESSLEASLMGIRSILQPLGSAPGDWQTTIDQRKASVAQQQQNMQVLEKEIQNAQLRQRERAQVHSQLKEQLRQQSLTADTQREELNLQLTLLEDKEGELTAQTALLRRQIMLLCGAVDTLKNALAGTVICPRCRHEFLTSDERFDPVLAREQAQSKAAELEAGNRTLKETYSQLDALGGEREGIRKQQENLSCGIAAWKEKVANSEQQSYAASQVTESLERRRRQITDTIQELTEGVEGIRRKMFDEAFDRLEAVAAQWESQLHRVQSEISTAEGAIEALEEHIREIDTPHDTIASLQESLKEYRIHSGETLQRKEQTQRSLGRLQEQQERFVQFKTYLANTKIEALGRITNEFLENIGSDIRIRFSGYTLLKSGKVREKISISLIRDGVDCGSFGKFSAGEAARVNLATILSMQKLINAGCEQDRGLDLVILDEILEAVDEDGLANMFEALNRLGITALVVSHGNISESYPHKLIIVKENGCSRIEY